MARYLAARAGGGASIATLRLATSAISKAHEWAGHESPCRDPGVPPKREMIGESFLKGSLHSTAALAPSLDQPAAD